MRALVVGGSGSGKSAFAENLACSLSSLRTYVATMTGHDAETNARIARHRQQRMHKGFKTIECVGTLCPQALEPHPTGVALLDDLGNLVSNALFSPDGRMANPAQATARLDHELDQLCASHRHVVVVAAETGSEGPSSYQVTHTWQRVCGTLCCRLAARFDVVVEVVCGVPCVVKGTLP